MAINLIQTLIYCDQFSGKLAKTKVIENVLNNMDYETIMNLKKSKDNIKKIIDSEESLLYYSELIADTNSKFNKKIKLPKTIVLN